MKGLFKLAIAGPLVVVTILFAISHLPPLAFLAGTLPLFHLGLKEEFDMETAPQVAGLTFLVTGSNAGIGKENVRLLALKKGTVVMACRKVKDCEASKRDIETDVPGADLHVLDAPLDLGSLKSVAGYVKAYKASKKPLNVLILNAGIMHVPHGLSEDGFEMHMAVNHFGHALLTLGLTDLLMESKTPPRVVVLSSIAHWSTVSGGISLSLDKMNDPNSYASRQHAYGQSKLANIMFSKQLQKYFDKRNKKAYVNSVHPGGVVSNLMRHSMGTGNVQDFLQSLIYWSTEKGAYTQMHCAISPFIETKDVRGKYHVPIGREEDARAASAFAHDEALAEKFWTFTLETLRAKGHSDLLKNFAK